MSFPRYPTYKDAGSEWLGEVPESWRVSEGKRLFTNIRDRADDGAEQLAATQAYGVVPQKQFMERQSQKVVLALAGTENFKQVHIDDFVISLRSFQGGIEHSAYHGCVSPAYTVLRATQKDHLHTDFYKYLFKEISYISALQSVTTGIREGRTITYEQFGAIPVPIPSQIEQIQIAGFLNHETVKIDTLIEEQKRLIELLKEKRQAVISHAVTKGLDPNVSMKDSGVEWLGEVPAHWGIVPLKLLSTLNPRKSGYTGDHSQLCSFVPMEKLKTGLMILDEDQIISDVFDGYTYFEDSDVLQAKVTPCFENKNIAVARNMTNGVGFGSSEINVLRPNKKITSQFLYYRLQEDGYMDVCTASMTGAGGLKRVPSEIIENFRIALPDLHEQESIVQHLDAIVLQTDSLVAYAEDGIELLHERRSALISAAVTGKIDVRDWQPPTSSAPIQQENMMETTCHRDVACPSVKVMMSPCA